MHICPEEILPVLAMLPFIGHFFRKLRLRWLSVHVRANTSTKDGTGNGKESANACCSHDHSKYN